MWNSNLVDNLKSKEQHPTHLSCFTSGLDRISDFNINYFDDNQINELKMLMDTFNLTQVVQSPTFVSSGSLLDHIYITPGVNVDQKSVISVYYSDHEAIKITVNLSLNL